MPLRQSVRTDRAKFEATNIHLRMQCTHKRRKNAHYCVRNFLCAIFKAVRVHSVECATQRRPTITIARARKDVICLVEWIAMYGTCLVGHIRVTYFLVFHTHRDIHVQVRMIKCDRHHHHNHDTHLIIVLRMSCVVSCRVCYVETHVLHAA